MRLLLAAFTLCAVVIALLGDRIRASREQETALDLLQQHGIETIRIDNWMPPLEVEGVILFLDGRSMGSLSSGESKEVLRAIAFVGSDVRAVVHQGDAGSRWSEVLARCSQLHSLEIHNTKIQPADVRALASLRALRKLEIASDCAIDPAADFAPLARACPLAEVLVHCRARSRHFEALVRSPRLKCALFDGLAELDAAWQPITSSELEGVYLRRCSLSAEQLQHFWKLPQLRVLSIGCADPAAVKNLTPGPELRWLAVRSSDCEQITETSWASVGGVQMSVSEH